MSLGDGALNFLSANSCRPRGIAKELQDSERGERLKRVFRIDIETRERCGPLAGGGAATTEGVVAAVWQ